MHWKRRMARITGKSLLNKNYTARIVNFMTKESTMYILFYMVEL